MATKNPPKVEQQAPAFNPFERAEVPAAPSLETAFDVTKTEEAPKIQGNEADFAVINEAAEFNEAAFRAIMSGQGLGNTKVNAPHAAKRNPFATPVPPPPSPKAAPEAITRPDGTPSWSDFAKFIGKHGKDIIAAVYPWPLGEVVETMWRGVPVVHCALATEVRHITEGWISWDIASSEE